MAEWIDAFAVKYRSVKYWQPTQATQNCSGKPKINIMNVECLHIPCATVKKLANCSYRGCCLRTMFRYALYQYSILSLRFCDVRSVQPYFWDHNFWLLYFHFSWGWSLIILLILGLIPDPSRNFKTIWKMPFSDIRHDHAGHLCNGIKSLVLADSIPRNLFHYERSSFSYYKCSTRSYRIQLLFDSNTAS